MPFVPRQLSTVAVKFSWVLHCQQHPFTSCEWPPFVSWSRCGRFRPKPRGLFHDDRQNRCFEIFDIATKPPYRAERPAIGRCSGRSRLCQRQSVRLDGDASRLCADRARALRAFSINWRSQPKPRLVVHSCAVAINDESGRGNYRVGPDQRPVAAVGPFTTRHCLFRRGDGQPCSAQ